MSLQRQSLKNSMPIFNLKPNDRELVALSKAIVANDLGEMIAKLEEAEAKNFSALILPEISWK